MDSMHQTNFFCSLQCSHAGAILLYLEFKRLVGNPDLQLARYVQNRLKEVRQAGSASWESTNMPAVGLCITGNSLRYAGTSDSEPKLLLIRSGRLSQSR